MWRAPATKRPACAAEPDGRALPNAEIHRLDSGHFAVEDSLAEIAGKMVAFRCKGGHNGPPVIVPAPANSPGYAGMSCGSLLSASRKRFGPQRRQGNESRLTSLAKEAMSPGQAKNRVNLTTSPWQRRCPAQT
jgi:hypothetical protein